MADFNLAYELINHYEGGYVDHPLDKGGETYRGIARNLFPLWRGWKTIDKEKAKSNFQSVLRKNTKLNSDVVMFYRKEFWDKLRGNKIPSQFVANKLLDIAVNMGIKRAVYFLQRSLNVLNKNGALWRNIQVDGVIGDNTMSVLTLACNKNYAHEIAKTLNVLQGARYITLCERNPSQEVFYRGWLKRVNL